MRNRGFRETVQRLSKELNNDFIITMESSSSMLDMCNTNGLPVKIFVETKNVNIPNTEVIVVNSLKPLRRNTVRKNGVSVRTVEATIVDLLRRDGDPQTIVETLSNYYYDNNENWGRLETLMNLNGVRDKFNSYTEDAIESGYH